MNSCLEPRRIRTCLGFYWAAGADRSSAPFDAQEGCGCVCVMGGWGTLFNHIFYLFSSLIAMTVAAPCTPTTLAGRLTGLKADTPITPHLWWGSGGGQLQPSLVLIWGHRSASVQVIYTSEPSPPAERVVRGRKLVSATLKCAFFKFHTRKEWKEKMIKSSESIVTCFYPLTDSGRSHSPFPVNNNCGYPEWGRFLPVNVHQRKPTGTEFHWFPPVSRHQHAADRLNTAIRLLLFIWGFCCQSLFCRMTDNSPERRTSDMTHHAKPP